MSKEKINVVIGMLHAFIQESAKNKGIEIVAKAKYNMENNQRDIEEITNSVNEFLEELEKVPFKSNQIELISYHGLSPKKL